MKKYRIIKKQYHTGKILYFIQQRVFFFFRDYLEKDVDFIPLWYLTLKEAKEKLEEIKSKPIISIVW